MSTSGKKATATALAQKYAPQIANKTVLVTGVSPNSLGATFVTAIAVSSPALLILAGRNAAKVEETTKAIRAAAPHVPVRFLNLDLADRESVRKAAGEVLSWQDVPGIDVLVNNACLIGSEYKLIDGFEAHFVVNYLHPFLFTNLLLPKVLAVKGRVVNVASDCHRWHHIRFSDLNFDNGKIYNMWQAYGQSKTANMLFSLALARRLGGRGIVTNSLHPGIIQTNAASRLDPAEISRLIDEVERQCGLANQAILSYKTVDEGTATHVYAAFEPGLKDHNGAYLLDSHVADPVEDPVAAWGTSEADAEKLWRLSEKLLGEKFEW
ncbi:hypothetical protein MCOR27_004712 [Pyricularia oryzae]|uniref:Retinol dehydrogenase 11 n=1 Tax=Pyricularia grisea TaxID=148305 RepID=A0ABQ8NSB8_PYRGI|nr:hypothetical protein MCOR19_002349 [Pyricularia oryzae]KAI6301435.1 hypothetical protein MCOR33_003110 [Pyricularia grisea]KAI6280292.1 hypothetical protein MCOR27_004712 [Pyricularia oryzae]KAI6329182.1 hypothetical protein MCOR29_002308 [Pyricularia oryzae]KAI6416706.1 hypothetical protein MCOR20_000920 [Pyricularia oryzae]